MNTLPEDIGDKIKEGQKDAFDLAFRTGYESLCYYANKFVKDMDQSEEIVQEVYYQLWKNHTNLNIETSLKSYLYRAVHNSCLNHIKHLKVVQDHENHVAFDNFGQLDFGKTYEYYELEEQIQIAVDALSPERKKVFQLSRNAGLKYSEIAKELNISIKTVENQMGKALKILRENLKDFISASIFFIFFHF